MTKKELPYLLDPISIGLSKTEGGRRLMGLYRAADADIFRQAAAETGLEVVAQPTEKTYFSGSDKPEEPAVELVNTSGKDLSPFWKRVKELESDTLAG